MKTITLSEYATRVGNRCSKEFHEDIVPGPVLAVILKELIANCQLVDVTKKALFYNKLSFDYILKFAFVASKYEWVPEDGLLSMDEKFSPQQQQIIHAILGIITEAGELAEALIEALGNVQIGKCSLEDAFDHVNLREEFGDGLWYTQLGLSAIGSNIEECITINDAKLERRYGPTFDRERAVNRDLDAEREELKK